MEASIGRYLTTEEVVHHVDLNKTNDAIDNLRLFATQGDHMAFHGAVRRERTKREDEPCEYCGAGRRECEDILTGRDD